MTARQLRPAVLNLPPTCDSRARRANATMHRPVLHISEILERADAFRRRFRRWPGRDDGEVPGRPGLTWCAVDQALRKGHRGLRPGTSLARLLLEQRGRRHRGMLPDFSLGQVLGWADAHQARTGEWPSCWSGPIREAPGETWRAVDKALRKGARGFPGGSSLARLLAERRGARNRMGLPPLALEQVLAWADAHHERTGRWPTCTSGPIPEAPGDTWAGLNESFGNGTRGLAGYGSLARFLARHRGVRNGKNLPRLRVRDILTWARAHRRRTGRWPRYSSGPIPEAPGETWGGVNAALYGGWRGMPGGSSLYRLLREQYGGGRAGRPRPGGTSSPSPRGRR